MNIGHFSKIHIFRLLLTALLLSASSTAKPYLALVLSGGGARGLAQVGVLKAFEERGIRPDLIIATSMGAIIGALYSAGYPADSIAHFVKKVDWNKIYSNSSKRKTLFVSQKHEPYNTLVEVRFDYDLKPILPNAISHGQAFYERLAPLLAVPQYNAGSDFDKLPIPLRIIATDLLSGNRVVFSMGNICTAIRASCAVPLAFTPVAMDSTLLIDGGVSANIPVETAREMGAELVIAIDVTSPLWNREMLNNPVRMVDQIVAISVARQKNHEKSKADIIITPRLDSKKNTDFTDIDSLVHYGYSAAVPYCDSINNLISSGTAAGISDPDSTVPPPPVINDLQLMGNNRTSDRILWNASGLKKGDTLSPVLVQKSISSLYATDLFENVNIDIDSSGTGRIMVEEKKYWRLRTGLRFDEFHLGEGYIEPAYENCFGMGVVALLHLQYGLRREKYTLEIINNHLFSRNFAYNLQMRLYSSKEKIQEIVEIDTFSSDSVSSIETTSLRLHTLRKSGLNFSLGTQLGRFTMLNAGMRLERFRLQLRDTDIFGDILGLSFRNTLPYFSLKLTMDSMDKYPFPTSGLRQYFSFGGANKAFGGRYSFIKCTGSIGQYFTFLDHHTVFPQFSFSWANAELPEVERAYIGGAIPEERYQELSVYNYIPFFGLPPRAMIGDMFGICHFEYRCEIKNNIFLHCLFDWGTTWDKKNGNYQKLIEDAPLGIGFGISYFSILGPVRFSYGQLLKNSERYLSEKSAFFYFSAGYDF